jgi:hypothetical protein
MSAARLGDLGSKVLPEQHFAAKIPCAEPGEGAEPGCAEPGEGAVAAGGEGAA